MTASTQRTDIVAQGVMAMSEKNFQTRVIQLAKFHGWELVYHTHDSRRSVPGFPDLVLVSSRRGRVMFRELKAAKERVSPEQREWLAALGVAGQDAGIWKPAGLLDGSIVAELAA